MRNRVAKAAVAAALMLLSAGPVAAGNGAWVDRIENVDTVLIVRLDEDFPLASIMRATCDSVRFVHRPDGSGVEKLRCRLTDDPVMIPEFQGQPPDTAFTHRSGACEWASDYWFAKDESLVFASSFHYSISASGLVHATATYPAEPLICE